VTIVGQSAGASSVFLLTASPAAKGLFHRAVIESGPGALSALGGTRTRAAARPRADAEKEGAAYATALGAHSLAELRAMPASAFVITPVPPGTPPSPARPRLGPVVDGRVLVEDPTVTFAAGRQSDVPTITGLNADEGSSAPTYAKLTAEQRQRARDAGLAGVQRVLTERAATAHAPAFAYFFDRVIPWPEHPEFGAFHTSEVPYVFGTIDLLARPWTDVDRTLSSTMMSYWVNFATTGDPNGPGLARWPAFDPAKPMVMRLGERVEPREPLTKERYQELSQ
jgi:para-nitrobenzyl esterase